jgi:hypothetical protein
MFIHSSIMPNILSKLKYSVEFRITQKKIKKLTGEVNQLLNLDFHLVLLKFMNTN